MIDLSSWRVRTRLTVGFGAVCALLVLSVVMGLIAMGRMQADMVSIAHDHWPKIATAANLTTQTDTIAIALRNMMLNPDAADRERQQQVIAKARKDTEDNLQTLDRLLTTAPDREMLRKVQELRSRYFAGLEELRPLILADQNNEAREYLAARLHPVLGEYKTAIGALMESEKNAINDNDKDAAVTYADTRNLLLGLGVVALLLSACLGWLITRSLVRELGGEPQVAAKMARAVAEGDFTQAITVRPGDQTSLMAQLAAMKESLARVVAQVRRSSESVAWPAPKSLKATRTCRHAPKARPARWKKPPPPWSNWAPPCARTPTPRARPTSWHAPLPTWPSAVVRWWARWCRP